MADTLHFGEWLCSQVTRTGGAATDRGIRLLARLVQDDETWPGVAISYSTYHRWLMRYHRHSPEVPIYQLSLDAAWAEWEAILQHTKLDAAKE
jgi:hypothetical protein